MDRHHVGGGGLLRYVLLCCALGCISAAIASPGTYFGVLQGGLEGSLEGRTGVFIASWNLFGCFQKRIWDLLELC